jgi:hypothetical protein
LFVYTHSFDVKIHTHATFFFTIDSLAPHFTSYIHVKKHLVFT